MCKREKNVSEEYTFTAQIYDPLLFVVMHRIRNNIVGLVQNPGARILDLCCGTGDQLKKMSDAGFHNLTGVDHSKAMLKQAGKTNKIKALIHGDAQHTGLAHASFDIIIISFAVHEKSFGVQQKMLAEAHRLLAPFGQIILVDFSVDDKAKKIAKTGAALVERMAGREHYAHFNAYVKNGGMPPLIENRFTIKKQIRHAMGVVSIWLATAKKQSFEQGIPDGCV